MKKIITLFLIIFVLSGCNGNKETVRDISEMEYIDALKYLTEKELRSSEIKEIVVENSKTFADCIDITYLSEESTKDETDFVNRSFSYYVNICREAYTHKDALPIYFHVDGTLIDQKGNKERRTLIYLMMDIDKFNTYNWENLKYQNLDFDLVSSDCVYFLIKKPTITTFDPSGFMYK